MDAIEEAVPLRRIRFVAESSLSLLSEPHLKRLKQNGFVGMMPGIESWYEHGAKSKTGRHSGMEKVRQVSDHVNMMLRYIPLVQTNFVLGLDSDSGSEPFELTKRFIDLAPGAFPIFNLFTCYGRAAPLNLELQRAERVLPFPFFFLDGNHAMNVKPLNYEWREFYGLSADLTRYAFTGARVWRRFAATHRLAPRLMNALRGHFSLKRVEFHGRIRDRLETDPQMRPFFEGTSTKIPAFYVNRMRALGQLWEALPQGAIQHDQNAFRNDPAAYRVVDRTARITRPRALVA
jgi:hypothetical protein